MWNWDNWVPNYLEFCKWTLASRNMQGSGLWIHRHNILYIGQDLKYGHVLFSERMLKFSFWDLSVTGSRSFRLGPVGGHYKQTASPALNLSMGQWISVMQLISQRGEIASCSYPWWGGGVRFVFSLPFESDGFSYPCLHCLSKSEGS